MEWQADVTAGDWLARRLDTGWATMHHFVPRGFATYTRVFPPVIRERPVGRPWPPSPVDRHRRDWERFARDLPEIDSEDATWAEAARSFGTAWHPLVHWAQVVRTAERVGHDAVDDLGWRWSEPPEGRLDARTLAAIVEDALPSASAAAGFVAVWEGWGGMVGALRDRPSRVALAAADDEVGARHTAMLGSSIRDVFDRGFRAPTWHAGVLSDEISRGDRLRLPDRAHVLFAGDLAELADPAWPDHVPWATPGDSFAPSPSLVWPADRSWAIVTEVDFDTTIVAGPASVAARLAADPRLETAAIGEGADLSWDAGEVDL